MWRAIFLLGLMALSGLAGWWSADWKSARPSGEGVYSAYLLDNGFHTDLALPVELLLMQDDALANATRQTLSPFEAGDWVMIGWGDSRFYQAQAPIRQRIPDGLRALFSPRGSVAVVQMIAIEEAPTRMWADEAYRVPLDHEGALALRARLLGALALEGEAPKLLGVRGAYRPHDTRYFESSERFSVIYLCNHWMASLLHAGGVDMPVGRALLSSEVVKAVKRHDHRQTGLEGAR